MIKLVFLAVFMLVVWIIWNEYNMYKSKMRAIEKLEKEKIKGDTLNTKRDIVAQRLRNDLMKDIIDDFDDMEYEGHSDIGDADSFHTYEPVEEKNTHRQTEYNYSGGYSSTDSNGSYDD